MTADQANQIAAKFVQFLESGNVPAGLFADDIFCDFTMPLWRLQAQGIDGTVRLRRAGHPGPGHVPRWRCDPTPTGFVIEFEERWEQDGKDWSSREMARIDVRGDQIAAMSVYCTGDWDADRRAKHGGAVQLLRP
jgi:hypothetical protein